MVPTSVLSPDAIVATATALVDREGGDALSMRRLGADLGVEGMAIYHHVRSRDELLRLMADRLLAPLEELELPSRWREACIAYATALRGIALAHPSTFALVGLRPYGTASALGSVERLLAVLVNEGFEPAQALGVYRVVASYARGYALAEASGFTVSATDETSREILASLSAHDFPILGGRLADLVRLDPADAFATGLRALVEGLPDPPRATG